LRAERTARHVGARPTCAARLVGALVAAGSAGKGLVEEVEVVAAEQVVRQVGFESTALVPRADHVPGQGAGSACNHEERADQAVRHVVSLTI
jgi:hypothetical protein